MKTFTLLKTMLIGLVLFICFEGQMYAQVEIPKDDWTAYSFRYTSDRPPVNAIDGSLETRWGMGGSGSGNDSEGRWFMVDLGASYDIVKFDMKYLPFEQWTNNFILGFNLYITDYEYPVNPASGPKNEPDTDGDMFIQFPDSIIVSVEYPNGTESMSLEFPEVRGRYVWIVANGPTGDWWEINEIDVFKADDDQEPVDELEIAKDEWTAFALRYRDWGLPEWAIDNDRSDASIFGMGGSASEGRWFMVDMAESYMVDSVKLEYLRTGQNYIKGFNVYVTDKEYPFQAASGPGNTEDVMGQLFELGHPDVDAPAGVVEFSTAEPIQVVAFGEPVKGRYIWIVANGPGSDWWELHEFSAYGTKVDDTSVRIAEESKFLVYPNPMNRSGHLYVNTANVNGKELTISDMTGRIVYRNRELTNGVNTLDVKLNTGIYIISIPGQQARKLIVR